MGELEIDSRNGQLTGVLKGRSAAHLLREPLEVWSTDILTENIARSMKADVRPLWDYQPGRSGHGQQQSTHSTRFSAGGTK